MSRAAHSAMLDVSLDSAAPIGWAASLLNVKQAIKQAMKQDIVAASLLSVKQALVAASHLSVESEKLKGGPAGLDAE